MTSNEAVLQMVAALEVAGVPYMLVGSYSSNFYGVARATYDADFVIQIGPDALRQLTTQLGTELRLDPQMSFETVTTTSRFVVSAVHSQFKIELFLLSADPHDQARFSRRRRMPFLGREICVPSAEDVIITKLYWSKLGQRAKDTDDVRNVVAVQGDALDWNYIHGWCDQHGTRALLDDIRRSIPPP
jgi:hypothetical protein